MHIHTFLCSGGDIHSEQQLPAHMIRGEATTQAVADCLITTHADLKLKKKHSKIM